MAKDTNDTKTQELALTVTPVQAKALVNAIRLQIKSHERAARAQAVAGRTAVADTILAEVYSLNQLCDKLDVNRPQPF